MKKSHNCLFLHGENKEDERALWRNKRQIYKMPLVTFLMANHLLHCVIIRVFEIFQSTSPLRLLEVTFFESLCRPDRKTVSYVQVDEWLNASFCSIAQDFFLNLSLSQLRNIPLTLKILGWGNNYPHCMFHIYKNKGRDLTATQFFNMVPLLYNALWPSPHNMFCALRIKSSGLTDKPRMHRYIQLLIRGKPTASEILFNWSKQLSPNG
jgi:hypothetical protein